MQQFHASSIKYYSTITCIEYQIQPYFLQKWLFTINSSHPDLFQLSARRIPPPWNWAGSGSPFNCQAKPSAAAKAWTAAGSELLTSWHRKSSKESPTGNRLTSGPQGSCSTSYFRELCPFWEPRIGCTKAFARESFDWTRLAGSTSVITPKIFWGKCWESISKNGSRWTRLWLTLGSEKEIITRQKFIW